MVWPSFEHWRRVALAALLLALAGRAGAATIFCCDVDGKRLCGDKMPPECSSRAHRELTAGGSVRQVEAPPTPEQKAERAAEAERKQAADKQAAEQRRRDSALVNSYASEQDIDDKRNKAVHDASAFLQQAEDRYAEMLKAKQQLDNDAEFYQKKPMPEKLKSQIKLNQAELAAQQAVVEARKQDIEAIRVRFDSEKKRYIELTRGAPAPAADSRPR